jgi:hypothetical protein
LHQGTSPSPSLLDKDLAHTYNSAPSWLEDAACITAVSGGFGIGVHRQTLLPEMFAWAAMASAATLYERLFGQQEVLIAG